MRRLGFLAFALLTVAWAPACEDPVARGQAAFSDRGLGGATNQASCALCHDAEPTGRHSAGYPLAGATLRPSFWGGQVLDLLVAVDTCVTSFMGGDPIEPSSDEGQGLIAYLSSISRPERVPAPYANALPLTVPETINNPGSLDALPPGDATRGQAVYLDACHNCHGEAGSGKGRLTSKTSVVPNELIASTIFTDPTTKQAVVLEKIRHGKFFGLGGSMPPFGVERLDDQSVADLIAYFVRLGLPAR